ncbi:hypothetical protein COO91_04588 [Nostoc flagelliforme CCNUN1]|uniref:Uncharacterized protein n=1 Tax=Nostoc flagelliforme CCNUN1 TaxID=2038116 RepID=A0A2K8ST86_9NOSO|nr:hypothetical protein COO91_04588 [Nostoc flagelliforme CCNUN1]
MPYAPCPMPNAQCPMPNSQLHTNILKEFEYLVHQFGIS